MRDANRLKEKIDLSLDNRQIGSLLIACVVVLGAVFVLGVVVGKKLAVDARAQHAPDLLSALDQKSAALNEPPANLTFHDELTRKSDPPAPVEVVAPEPAKAAAPPAPVVAEPPAPSPAPAAKPKAPSEPAEKVSPAAAQRAPPRNAYSLQLSASQNRTEADRFLDLLKGKGYAAYIVEAHVPGKGTWYRVRMGNFPNREAAAKYLADFKRETQLDAFVAGPQ